ncbi:uncharacterized protein LOC127266073 [Andrographis paniculata]|uniref:uncharacterized protein LOC127266073 n=1 Tax=Andrographis paniculata TaxID=175694 RepID=UPI0021E7E675|nr:uncharacterized protein LOC127266073 [Andrographis paniculata]
MTLASVKMSEEVWWTCLTHALSTESEEIMGLLLGDIQHSENDNVTALIWGALPQPRCDRKKDRVETNPEQLTAAAIHAERMTIVTGTTTRVIGWYHSHLHTTVLPSHVDVGTQALYQLLESGFIGLIFSCFNEDAHKVGRIQVMAFQSLDGKQNVALQPVSIASVQEDSLIDSGMSMSSLDNTTAILACSGGESIELGPGDSQAAIASKGNGRSMYLGSSFVNADAKTGNKDDYDSSNNAIYDLDPMDMAEDMEEAMRLSNLERSGAEYVGKEIPLLVLPAPSLLNLNDTLSSFSNLQNVIYEEEKTTYYQVMEQIIRDKKVHPLSFIHHASTYKASMCKMIEYCLGPAIKVLQDRLRENELLIKLLGEEAIVLKSELESGKGSP